MLRSSPLFASLAFSALVAFALIASAEEAASPSTTESAPSHDEPLEVTLASALSATPAPAPPSTAPRLVKARLGAGSVGTTRLVLELDQDSEFLAVELMDRPGAEVRLLGTTTESLPATIEVNDGRVRRVTFSEGARDLVVRVEGVGPRLTCRAFALHDPSRVVIDLEEVEKSVAPVAKSSVETTKPTPRVALKPESKPATPVFSVAPSAKATADTKSPLANHFDSSGVTTDDGNRAASVEVAEPKFEEFLDWVNQFREHAEAIGPNTPEGEKVRHWRKLASLLQKRGLVDEAERTLDRALRSPEQDTTHAFTDSLRLAELRVEAGRGKDALAVARKLSPFGCSTDEKLRLASILALSGAPIAARAILEETMSRVPADKRPAAELLLARCLWDGGAVEKALHAVDALSSEERLPRDVEERASVLRADCLFALGRISDSRAEYERATRFDLGPEEAAWTRLQLGNVAHREGRLEDAKTMYREAATSWPNTFYATQAAWFLRTTERLEAISTKREDASRG